MSGRAQMRAMPKRTSQILRGDDLILALAGPTRRVCNWPSTPSPQYRFLSRRGRDDASFREPWSTHFLLLQQETGQAIKRRVSVARLHRHPYIGALQTSVSIELQFSRISPAFPRSLASVLIPRPAALGVLLRSPWRTPSGSGFPNKNLPRNIRAAAAQTAGEIFLRSLRRKHAFGLGSGAHSRRCAQECPEGNSGKYTQEK